jgi:hypothetical protein
MTLEALRQKIGNPRFIRLLRTWTRTKRHGTRNLDDHPWRHGLVRPTSSEA